MAVIMAAKRQLVVGGLLLVLAVDASASANSALDWLETAAAAGHQNSYSGIFVYQYDDNVATSNIIHLNETGSEYEKLDSLDGPRREIIRHDGQVWSFTHHHMVQMDGEQGRGSFPSLSPEQLAALSNNYRGNMLGEERVAGYDAQVVLFQPKDSMRYAHKMWFHSDTGLLLKAAVLDDKDRVAEQYAFTQLQIGGKLDHSWIKERSWAWTHGKQKNQAPDAVPELADTSDRDMAIKSITPIHSGWVADRLPVGFKKTMEVLRTMHGKHAPVTQIVFSDGMSAISIFIEPNDSDEDDVEGLSSRGAVNLYRRVMNQNLITVVGEVPPHAVMQVLESVRFNGK